MNPPHGSYARYQRELRARRVVPCDACTAANRWYRQGQEQQTVKCSRRLGWPLAASPALAEAVRRPA